VQDNPKTPIRFIQIINIAGIYEFALPFTDNNDSMKYRHRLLVFYPGLYLFNLLPGRFLKNEGRQIVDENLLFAGKQYKQFTTAKSKENVSFTFADYYFIGALLRSRIWN
jgi:hypothetical protein